MYNMDTCLESKILHISLSLLTRHHLGAALGPALSPGWSLAALLVLLLLLRSLLDERGHQARVALQNAQDLLVLLLRLRALEGLYQLLEGELLQVQELGQVQLQVVCGEIYMLFILMKQD